MTSYHASRGGSAMAVAILVAVFAVAADTRAGLAAGPSLASQIDASTHLGTSRAELKTLYPTLSSRELDLLAFRIADLGSMGVVASSGPSGNWFCTSETLGGYRLTMGATSYSLVARSRESMAGEYQSSGGEVVVSSGPLRGIGVANGTLAVEEGERILTFQVGDSGTLKCVEIL